MSLVRRLLGDTPLLQHVEPETVDALARLAGFVSLEIGRPFQRAGHLAPGVALVVEGRLRRVWNPPLGEPLSLGSVGVKEWLGWGSALRDAPDLSLMASSPCQLVLIPLKEAREALLASSILRQALAQPLPEELAVLLLPEIQRRGLHLFHPREALDALLPHCHLLANDANEAITPGGDDWLIYSGPAMAGAPPIGSRLAPGSPWPLVSSGLTLPARILALPEAVLAPYLAPQSVAGDVEATPPVEPPPEEEIPTLNLRSGEGALAVKPPDSIARVPHRSGAAGGFPGGVHGRVEQALTCVLHLAAARKAAFSADQIRRNLQDVEDRLGALKLAQVGLQLEALGFDTRPLRARPWNLSRLEPPVLLDLEDAFVLLLVSAGGGGVLIGDPRVGLRRLTGRQLEELAPAGLDVLVVREGQQEMGSSEGFGLGWFLPAFLRHRGLLGMTLFTAFTSQLLSAVFPIGVLAVIDQVISNNNPSLLAPLSAVLIVTAVASSILSTMRSLISADLSDRVDVRLGSSVVEHLMRLPLPYFERRQVGGILYNVNQLYQLRQFVVDQLLGVGLDAIFAVVFLLVLFWISPTLTLIVVLVAPILMLLNALASPILIRLIRESNNYGSAAGAYLYEVVSGMRTVKSQNFEVEARWQWLERYRAYTNSRYHLTQVGSLIKETGQLLSKASDIALIVVGAGLILSNKITLGALFAVKILSGQVISPLLRLSSLWQGVQEMRLSLTCLADVMLALPEVGSEDRQSPPLPPVQGHLRFDGVSFRYGQRGRLILDELDLTVEAGEFVGIVGLSGSGKSTLVQLIDRLYLPKQGHIQIDGIDVSKVQLASLRRRIGYVPQDSLLFEGTVLDNIRLNNPDASIESVMDAARVAAAHEFIEQLENGYATVLGERGAGLSGGQRQRVCLARTVLQGPSLLILDEATSALDAETELQVCRNLSRRFAGTTVLFITHRLTTLSNADRILFMERGRIIEDGSHQELLARRGAYATLYRQQVGEQ